MERGVEITISVIHSLYFRKFDITVMKNKEKFNNLKKFRIPTTMFACMTKPHTDSLPIKGLNIEL